MSAPKLVRRPRSVIMKVDEMALHAELEEVAAGGELEGVSWNGSHYPKRKRTDGPDIAMLALSLAILTAFIKAAPNGFPDHVGVKQVGG